MLTPLIHRSRRHGWWSVLTLVLALGMAATAGAAPSGRSSLVGTVSYTMGGVWVTHGQSDEWVAVQKGDDVREGDRFKTGIRSRLKLDMKDGSVIRVAQRSQLSIKNYLLDAQRRVKRSTISMLWGKARFAVAKLFGNASYEFETPTAVAGVRGTEGFIIIEEDAESARLHDAELVRLARNEQGPVMSDAPFQVADLGGGGAPRVRTYIGLDHGRMIIRNRNPNILGSVTIGARQFTQIAHQAPPSPPATFTPAFIQQKLGDELGNGEGNGNGGDNGPGEGGDQGGGAPENGGAPPTEGNQPPSAGDNNPPGMSPAAGGEEGGGNPPPSGQELNQLPPPPDVGADSSGQVLIQGPQVTPPPSGGEEGGGSQEPTPPPVVLVPVVPPTTTPSAPPPTTYVPPPTVIQQTTHPPAHLQVSPTYR